MARIQVGVYTELLGFSVTPTGNTQYGTPRTFSATVVNVNTGPGTQTYNGNVSFVDGNGKTLCTTPAVNDASLLGVAVRPTDEQSQAL